MSTEEKQMSKAMEASKEEEEIRLATLASLEDQELLKAIEASKEADELRQANKERKPIIPPKASIYINPSSLIESYALQEIRNDVSHQQNILPPDVQKPYIPPQNDCSHGIITAIVQLGIVTYAFVVENEDGSYSLIRIYEISHINGIVRKQEKPNIGDSIFWVKMDSGESAGGGTAFQFPHGTLWRSTQSGYRWTDSDGIEQSRFYLS